MCRQPSSPLLSGSDGLNEPDVPVDGARVAAALTVLIETVQRYVSDAEAPSAERLRWESTMARAHALRRRYLEEGDR